MSQEQLQFNPFLIRISNKRVSNLWTHVSMHRSVIHPGAHGCDSIFQSQQ